MKIHEKIVALLCVLVIFVAVGSQGVPGMVGCQDTFASDGCQGTFATAGSQAALGAEAGFTCEIFPLERNGIPLHLDRVKKENITPAG